MKNIILTLFILNCLASCGQNQTKNQTIKIDNDEIEFATITYNKSIPNSYNEIDTRRLTKSQFEILTKAINYSTPKGKCKIGAVYTIRIYLPNDTMRVFRGNGRTIKEKSDYCYYVSDKNFYEKLWRESVKITIDFSKIALLPLNDCNVGVFASKKEATLKQEEIKEIEVILQHELNIEKIKDLDTYYRQYLATYNENGEKEVWINFLCNTFDSEWTRERVIVEDGGNCYFNLKVNLSTGKILELNINGEA